MILNEADARALTQKILALSKAEGCIVSISGGQDRHIRFAQNMATTSGAPGSLSVSVESHFGLRSGSASTTELTDKALAALVEASEKRRGWPRKIPSCNRRLGRRSMSRVRVTRPRPRQPLRSRWRPLLNRCSSRPRRKISSSRLS